MPDKKSVFQFNVIYFVLAITYIFYSFIAKGNFILQVVCGIFVTVPGPLVTFVQNRYSIHYP